MAPGVAQVARQYEGKVQFVGVPGRDSLDQMRTFVDRHGVGLFPHAADPDGDLWAQLGVRFQSTWIFVNDDGQAEVEFGDFEEDELRARLDALLAA